MIHKRRFGGLAWNYAGLTIWLVLLAAAFALGAVEFAVAPWALAPLLLGAIAFAVVSRAATRRRS